MQSRRDFLKLAALLTGAAGLSGAIPESVQRAYAIAPEPGTTYLDAEHIVILMQENRSFDHTFGTLKGVRGFNDPRALRLPNGNSVFVQTDHQGNSYAPWRLDIRDTRVTWMGSIPHSRNSQVDAWNGGAHDRWLDSKRSGHKQYSEIPLTMGHYTREDLPFYYALADAFTVCDQNYCAVMTSTTPNRSTFWTGTIRNEQRMDSRVFIRNDQYEREMMTWKTYPERLQEAGISWKFYQNELTAYGGFNDDEEAWLGNFGCNILENFAAFDVYSYQDSKSGIENGIEYAKKHIANLDAKAATTQDSDLHGQLQVEKQHIEKNLAMLETVLGNCGESRYNQLPADRRAVHDAAFVTNSSDPHYRNVETLPYDNAGTAREMTVPKGDVLYQFRKDVNEGKLPTISWLSGPERFSDHPTAPWYGAWYVSEVMDILTKNPEVWKKTIFILTYDENDGYFDHAPSFVAADPKRPETGRASEGIDTGLEYTYAEDELAQGVMPSEARSGPIGMGFRVPMVIASPWTRGGWVNSQLFDHTSTLMFLEDFVQAKFGKAVRQEEISSWRRTVAGDLKSCFRTYEGTEEKLDYLNRDKFVVSIQQARDKEIPSNYKALEKAEIDEINLNAAHSEHTAHQEPGIKPACALPYELYADGALSDDGKSFRLSMTAGNRVHGERAAGAPFNVYLRTADGESSAATYAVKAGDTLSEEIALEHFRDGRYRIDVHGPNGFFRSFACDPGQPNISVKTAYEVKNGQTAEHLQVLLHNGGSKPLRVTIHDHSYQSGHHEKKIAAGDEAAVMLSLKKSHGWYDFTVSVEGSPSRARYAGHVDTGRHSFTDPLMGQMA